MINVILFFCGGMYEYFDLCNILDWALIIWSNKIKIIIIKNEFLTNRIGSRWQIMKKITNDLLHSSAF